MTAFEVKHFPHLKESLYQTILPSGLRCLFIPKPDFRETTGMLRVDFGGVDTNFTQQGETVNLPFGTAHFLEHQVFENFGKEDFSQLFTKLGADSNAFTSFTSTHYFFSGVDGIEQCLELLLELVSQARFTVKSVDKERPIIKQEIDLYQDDPETKLYTSVLASLFPETSLAVDLAGSLDSIDMIDVTTLTRAFDCFYRPETMTLIVVGDLKVDELYKKLTVLDKKLIKETSVHLSRSHLVYNPVIPKYSLKMDVAIPKLGLGFRRVPSNQHHLFYKTALRLYLSMLIGWTSRTYQNWYDAGQIDDSFEITVEVSPQFEAVMIFLDTKEPIAMGAKIRQAVQKGRLSQDASEAHLVTLKKELYGEFLASLDRVDELANLCSEYLEDYEEQMMTSYLSFPQLLDHLTLEDVLRIGEEFFKSAEMVEVTIFSN